MHCGKCGRELVRVRMSARQAKLWVMIPWPEDDYDRKTGAKIYYWVFRCPKLSVWRHQHDAELGERCS
jgi:hypothetical protein